MHSSAASFVISLQSSITIIVQLSDQQEQQQQQQQNVSKQKDLEWSDSFLHNLKDFDVNDAIKDHSYLEQFQDEAMEQISACNYHAYHVIQDYLALKKQNFLN